MSSQQINQVITNRGGARAKKQKNHSIEENIKIILKDEGQEYGIVDKALGSGRFSVKCFDGKVRLGLLRGKLTKGINKKNNFIMPGDYVLISTRDFQNDKCDILLKYSDQHIRDLIKLNELPKDCNIKTIISDDNMPFEFESI